MRQPSVWIAAMSFGAIVSAHWSPPPQSTSDVPKRVIAPPGPKPVGPYSPGIMVGDFLLVSGQAHATATAGCLTRSTRRSGRRSRTSSDCRGRRVDAGARGLRPGVPCQHVEPRHDRWIGANTFRNSRRREPSSVSTGCPPTRRSRSMPSLSRSLPQKVHRPCRISTEFDDECGVMAGDRLYLSGSFGATSGAAVCPRIRRRRCSSRWTT